MPVCLDILHNEGPLYPCCSLTSIINNHKKFLKILIFWNQMPKRAIINLQIKVPPCPCCSLTSITHKCILSKKIIIFGFQMPICAIISFQIKVQPCPCCFLASITHKCILRKILLLGSKYLMCHHQISNSSATVSMLFLDIDYQYNVRR